MRAEAIVSAIIQKMSGIGNCQRKFIIHIVMLYLSLRTRYNFCSFARSGRYSEQSYRNNFSKRFDFKAFNAALIEQYCGKEKVIIFDPSYISKSGKATPGTGYFWSGVSSSMKWGMEIGVLSIGDIENHTAIHYHAKQTQVIKGEESLRSYYARIICEQSSELQRISKVIVLDAYFSKKEFVDAICGTGFTMVSRFASNIHLQYQYKGEQSGKGRPKTFDGKINPKNVSSEHFKIIEQSEKEIIYEGVGYSRALKRWCKAVIVNKLKDSKVKTALIYFSTDVKMSGKQILEHYTLRCQIEFQFRDAKQFLGLIQCQSRQEEALDFHFNMSLTTLNIAKVTHWLSVPKEERTTFSMADIKTLYINELLLNRLILIYGKDPKVEKNNPEILKLYNFGRIAA